MNLHSNESCERCRYFIADGNQSRCSVPIWMGGDYYREHYVRPNSWCAMFEKPEEAKDESKRR